jgi:prepilin-type N-terminal cleavage/methylation domain-containing protein
MSRTRNVLRPIQAGFTLVELLIVVIILTVLAAIIVPQFTSATIDAKEATLDANLARLRSSIELFHAQHANIYPGAVDTTGGSCPSGGAAGTGTANSAQALMDHMLMYSDANGKTCSIGDTTFKYGPYVRKGFPNDSLTGKGGVAADITVTSTGAPLAPSSASGGWAYDSKSGQLVMNSNANDTRGKAYSTH